MVAKIVRGFLKWKLNQDFKIAKKHADSLHNHTGKKYFVLYINGNFNCVEKQRVKQLLFEGKFFKRGVNMKQVEQYAYYITN